MTAGKTTLLIAGVLVAAFLGMFGASEFMHWREQAKYDQKMAGLETGESSLLRQGEKFPEIELTALDGTTISSQTLSDGSNALYLFLSVGCDPCTQAIEHWTKFQGKIPDNVKIYGISEDDIEYVKIYINKTGFPFPVYCDSKQELSSKYEMNIFPSAIGVSAAGTIAFIRHGIDDKFSPLEASEKLLSSK